MKIAVIGGGQLARMMALSGLPLGLQFSFLVEKENSLDTRCVDGLGHIAVHENELSPQAIFQALGEPDVITVEKEQVDVELMKALQAFCPVYPNPEAVGVCGDRHQEKQLLDKLAIPTARYVYLNHAAQVESAKLPSFPLFAKSTRQAYDGKNQHVLRTPSDVENFASSDNTGEWIVEEGINFEREVSIVAARSTDGTIAYYPVTENIHHNGILVFSISPSPNINAVHKAALESYAEKILTTLDYVGVLAIECFIRGDDVMVNELAPRVHNSGHWTQSSTATCQFENHIRAVAGLALGSTQSTGDHGMLNLIGVEAPPINLLNEHSTLHWYNKVPRPGRKVGHVNFFGPALTELVAEMHDMAQKIDLPYKEKIAL